jgi:branched-chain amino acid transport system ATP-binding protein
MSGELIIDRVCAGYSKLDVLQDVSLRVEPGTITSLLGSNGAGKTTLIRTILSLTAARRGRIIFDGVDITSLPPHRVIAAGISCIPEGRKVFPKMTVEENLYVGAYREKSKRLIDERLKRAYATFPRLQERRSQLAGTLSGGEQAMVSIGRSLMSAPRLLLIDEPSLGLSPALVDECFNVIERIKGQGITVFLVEQNVHQSLDIADYGYVLAKGRVVAAGAPDRLLDNPEMRQAYFGEATPEGTQVSA